MLPTCPLLLQCRPEKPKAQKTKARSTRSALVKYSFSCPSLAYEVSCRARTYGRCPTLTVTIRPCPKLWDSRFPRATALFKKTRVFGSFGVIKLSTTRYYAKVYKEVVKIRSELGLFVSVISYGFVDSFFFAQNQQPIHETTRNNTNKTEAIRRFDTVYTVWGSLKSR